MSRSLFLDISSEYAPPISFILLRTSALDRKSLVVGIGGRIVCDVTGFAASTYLRGLPFGFVPTTLLAQVDASIGGKNGVNFKGYKNLIGTIRQPEFCIIDFNVLHSLPEREIRSGFAEVVKHAAIGDSKLFDYLEGNVDALLSLHHSALERAIRSSLRVKKAIVQRDEQEDGERMKLNFGHTIGHGVEKTTGRAHGEAVSIGMVAEAKISLMRKILSKSASLRLERLLERFGLPTSMTGEDGEAIVEAVGKDKKRDGDSVQMVHLEKIGKARISRIGLNELSWMVHDLC